MFRSSAPARTLPRRQRAAALETQGRKEVPTIDIQKTCQAAAGAMVRVMGGTTTEQDINACLDSEQKARDQIVKDGATYSSADKKQCMRTGVYLPSYVEWLTCLEMERDVRKMQREDQAGADPYAEFGAGPYTRPNVSPAINPASIRQSQPGRERASSRRKGSGLEIHQNPSQNRLKRITRQARWTKPRKLRAWYSQRMRIRCCH